MRKFLMGLALLSSVALLSGCATILSGTTQKVNITTETGLKTPVLIDGQRFEAPTVVELKRERKDKFVVPEACPDQKVLLKSEVNPAFLGNILFGGLLGLLGTTVDYVSGAMWKYVPENVNVKCPPSDKYGSIIRGAYLPRSNLIFS